MAQNCFYDQYNFNFSNCCNTIPQEIILIYCEKRSINILHYKIFKYAAYEMILFRIYYF